MSDDDMISKTAALEAVKRETGFDDDHPAIAAIAALPAVTVGVRGHMLRSLLAKAVDDLSVGMEVDLIALERSVLAALTTTPEAVTPEAVADLARRLRGEYRIPITDGLGPAGGEEPDNAHEFVRHFPSPPIQNDAAAMIEALAADLARQTARADAAEEARLDAIDTLNAWFDRRKLGHAAVDQAVLDAASGYLRTSRSGGMPQEESDLILGVVQDMARLGIFADLFARAIIAEVQG